MYTHPFPLFPLPGHLFSQGYKSLCKLLLDLCKNNHLVYNNSKNILNNSLHHLKLDIVSTLRSGDGAIIHFIAEAISCPSCFFVTDLPLIREGNFVNKRT